MRNSAKIHCNCSSNFCTGNAYSKRFRGIAAFVGLTATLAASNVYAQSSVTLYGLISTGFQYVTNAGGSHQYAIANGPEQLPRFGLLGREDLGGGTAAIFRLENGFSITNGSLGQGGRMFGRFAYVGLQNDGYGTITMGRQLEEMASQLAFAESAIIFASVGTHIGDNDNLFYTLRFNNSVRYVSPAWKGLTFAASYAFSNATSFSNNRGFSVGGNYTNGPLKVAVAATQFNDPASASNTEGAVDDSNWGYSSPFTKSPANAPANLQRMYGGAATYDFNVVQAAVDYTNVLYEYSDGTGLRLQNAEVTLTKRITPALLLGAAYVYTWGDYSGGTAPKWHQFNLGTVYSLSKRTDLFLVGIYQRAAGDAEHAQIYSTTMSSGKSQLVVETGIRLKF
ncbi:porin [Paraburkholderia sp. J12]|uniref:porin n=1 Tax=Paraburkholderia sp. J12 TaxID=2805432 RepID=UPI002ABE0A75|nr:porin [Paraburkholderia sp. J12]